MSSVERNRLGAIDRVSQKVSVKEVKEYILNYFDDEYNFALVVFLDFLFLNFRSKRVAEFLL